jgi:hypothetical protein
MPAVATQQLATIADLDMGPANSAMRQALNMFTDADKGAYLRRASGTVLAAYAKRMPRTPGASFTLSAWGDFTIDLVVVVARWMMISDRGYNASSPADKAIRDRYDIVVKILDEIVDIDNKTPRIDPDAVGAPDADDEGPLAFSEGGPLDEADYAPTRKGRSRGCCNGNL